MFGKKKKNHIFIRITMFILTSGIVITTIILSYLIFEKKYHDKIYPDIYLDNIDLSNLTREQAETILNGKINKINENGIIFYHQINTGDKKTFEKMTIFPIISSFSGDIANEIIKFDIKKTIDNAFLIGRTNKNILPNSINELPDYFTGIREKIDVIRNGRQIEFSFYLNERELIKNLKGKFNEFEIPAKNAELIKVKQNNQINFGVSEEKLGKIIDYQMVSDVLGINLSKLDNSPIKMITKTDFPDVYREDGLREAEQANKILSKAPFNLLSTTSIEFNLKLKTWTISRNQLAEWLEIKKDNLNKTIIGLNNQAKQYIEEEIATTIDIEPIDAKVEIKDGKVNEFEQSKDGLKLNLDKNLAQLENYILKESETCLENKKYKNCKENKNINLVIEPALAKRIDDVNTMGIKEIIGVGESNFWGSPANRRHNIKIGAKTLNGLMIEPGKEFSLIKSLGKIDDSQGYLAELVIKGDQTIPEFGGGLCQIGTTIFRTVINTGLPVTMRRNHSYRVSYYEPAGTDATIYSPWPDFRFINDTQNHILIQTFMNNEANTLRFEFWGTNDGRIASATDPIIYNIVKPEPTKIIETTDLPVGKKKCTETAHNGADAYFDYTVTYPNDEVKKERFLSKYIPWREVCLIGVEQISTTSIENLESSNNNDQSSIKIFSR